MPAALPDQAATASGRSDAPADAPPGQQDRLAASTDGLDPRRFLLAVMNDPAAELRWRIEAAKALLPHSIH